MGHFDSRVWDTSQNLKSFFIHMCQNEQTGHLIVPTAVWPDSKTISVYLTIGIPMLLDSNIVIWDCNVQQTLWGRVLRATKYSPGYWALYALYVAVPVLAYGACLCRRLREVALHYPHACLPHITCIMHQTSPYGRYLNIATPVPARNLFILTIQ